MKALETIGTTFYARGDRYRLFALSALEQFFIGGSAMKKQLVTAPELLDAVKIALEYLEPQNHPRNIEEQIAFKKHQIEILKNAIAKAEGR